MASIELANIIKRYGNLEVVCGINLAIDHNEFIVLVGPSGCGKSTTLRMIAGLEEISAGKISIGDTVVNNLPPRKRNVSMVFQNYALYPHMTVAQNLGFGLVIAKQPEDVVEARVKEAASILGIEKMLERIPAELSGGERQRVAMGRAIVRHPQVFLFDEPLSNLDAKLRVLMRTEIKKLHQQVKTTVVYVTHDQVEAMTLADRMVVMKDGRIEQVGTPMEIFNHPVNAFVASFIGSPPMNQIPGQIVANQVRFADGTEVPVPARLAKKVTEGEKVIYGLRADDIAPEGHSMTKAQSAAKLQLRTVLSESLGAESLVFTEISGQEIQAKMFHPRPVVPNEQMTFLIDKDKAHLFNAQSGEALGD